MSKRKILKRGKQKPIKNLGLLRGKSWGEGAVKKVNGSWAQGVKPKAATKFALKASTSLTRPTTPAFKNTVRINQSTTSPEMSKGMRMLKRKATQTVPKNAKPTMKKYSPKM
jgi:hypothetical protein